MLCADLIIILEVMKDITRVRVNENINTMELERVMNPTGMMIAREAYQKWKLKESKSNKVQDTSIEKSF